MSTYQLIYKQMRKNKNKLESNPDPLFPANDCPTEPYTEP